MQFERLGPYRIDRQLGRGGMGTVYAAETIDTGIPAAVKVLSAALARDDGFRERFEAEIETLRKLRHPNIVRLYGFGEEDGYLFYGMELVEGSSLEDELQAGRRFNWQEVTQIGVKLCRALRHAHDRGVIHRDIKPANLLLGKDGEVKLSDFGIAKLFGYSGMTADGGVIGTAEYMSPEQADGRPVTHRCDLYSLGGVLYALCAGRPPFRARSLPEMLHMQRYADPEPAHTYAPDVPAELEQIIMDLLVKEPDKRIPTALVLARRLEAMEHGLLRRASREQTVSEPLEEDDFVYQPDVDPDRTYVATKRGVTENEDVLEYRLAGKEDLPATRLAPPEYFEQVASQSSGADPFGVTQPGTVEVAREADVDARATAVTLAAPVAAATSKSTAPARRFTTVEETDAEEPRATIERPISAQTGLLVTALLLLGLGGWYFLQPVSADKLYNQVKAAAATEQIEDLLAAESQMTKFLELYSSDPRAPELREFQSEIDLYRLERRFQRTLRGRHRDRPESPLERAYADAIRYAPLDPERAVAKLQAVVAVYAQADAGNPRDQQCLELARRQLEQLQGQVAEAAAADKAFVEEQLASIDKLARGNPRAARGVLAGIIELYADKRWAASLVEQARAKLSVLPAESLPENSPANSP